MFTTAGEACFTIGAKLVRLPVGSTVAALAVTKIGTLPCPLVIIVAVSPPPMDANTITSTAIERRTSNFPFMSLTSQRFSCRAGDVGPRSAQLLLPVRSGDLLYGYFCFEYKGAVLCVHSNFLPIADVAREDLASQRRLNFPLD